MISFIVPVWFKNSKYVEASLRSLIMLKGDYDFTVQLIGCGYETEYLRIAKSLGVNYWQTPTMKHFSKSVLLNAGWRVSDRDFICIWDGDFIATPDLLARMHDCLLDGTLWCFNQLRLTEGETQWSVFRTRETLLGWLAKMEPTVEKHIAGCNNFPPMLLSRALYEKVGGHCEEIVGWGWEDTDFENVLKCHQIPIVKTAHQYVWHLHHAGDRPPSRLSLLMYQARRDRMRAGEVLEGNVGEWGKLPATLVRDEVLQLGMWEGAKHV